MATMQAVRIHSFGGPEVLQLEEVPRPEPLDNEVLISIRVASVNPIDYKIRAGGYARPEALPLVLGRDIAGEVATLGAKVRDFKKGDAVFALLPRDRGGYAEYVALKTSDIVPMPDRVDFEHAGAVPLAAITAWQGLFDQGGLKQGQRVLIHGAAGGVGHMAVQLAKSVDAKVIVTASAADAAFLREIGADVVIDYKLQRFENEVRDVDLVLDLIGGETQERSWAVLKRGGTLVSTLGQPAEEKARTYGVTAKGYMAQVNADELNRIAILIDEGRVSPRVQRRYALRDVAEAHRHLEHEHSRGKTVLTIG
ncbi:MAG TPA: NADP-dependent oxidoreductase [Steroidobacteraceae bacterium]|jgi:NADPH:quinone reductase-like Zn-dependent oxidoreductase